MSGVTVCILNFEACFYFYMKMVETCKFSHSCNSVSGNENGREMNLIFMSIDIFLWPLHAL
jgi:hypothetical protein